MVRKKPGLVYECKSCHKKHRIDSLIGRHHSMFGVRPKPTTKPPTRRLHLRGD